jgi:hypothetical protein
VHWEIKGNEFHVNTYTMLHVLLKVEDFIQFPTWSCDEVQHLLSCVIASKEDISYRHRHKH